VEKDVVGEDVERDVAGEDVERDVVGEDVERGAREDVEGSLGTYFCSNLDHSIIS